MNLYATDESYWDVAPGMEYNRWCLSEQQWARHLYYLPIDWIECQPASGRHLERGDQSAGVYSEQEPLFDDDYETYADSDLYPMVTDLI
jgi:hypothetical protein